MEHVMSYNRVNVNGRKGFKLNAKRFSVCRLGARFMCFFRVLKRWRCSYGRALKLLLRRGCDGPGIKRNSSRSSDGSGRRLVIELPKKGVAGRECRLRSLRRSNSFYAEAIADCLEFIKRSSISLDQNPLTESTVVNWDSLSCDHDQNGHDDEFLVFEG